MCVAKRQWFTSYVYMNQLDSDHFFMREALKEAGRAAAIGEVPVGAVVVREHKIVARSHNQVELLQDPTAHAELLAITASTHYFNTKYLVHCTLYVTLEPCVMCSGALYWSQIQRIVVGAYDPNRGYSLLAPRALHPRTVVTQNVLAEESNNLLANFFKQLRKPYIA